MAAKLSNLSALAEKLNQSTEQVNRRIREVSKELADMDIGIELWLDDYWLHIGDYFTTDDGSGNTPVAGQTLRYAEIEQLGFAKVEDHWQLAVRTATYEHFYEPEAGSYYNYESHRLIDPQSPRPLLKASRVLRLKALALLDRLTDQLEKGLQESLRLATSEPEKE